MEKSAVISDCGEYRYILKRTWGRERDWSCMFIMLNPSTADADLDDPTIRRCVNFARDWGFGGIVVVNLFAFRATKPADMKLADDPVGPENETYIKAAFRQCSEVICAWGTHGAWQDQGEEMIEMLDRIGVDEDNIRCLGKTDMGHPRHPLYVPKVTLREHYP